MRIIDDTILEDLSNVAKKETRKRKIKNFHNESKDPLQRMLNAFEPNTYVQPHRHLNPPKREVFIILKGSIAFVFFDNNGKIQSHVVLDANNGVYGIEVEAGEWHSVISLHTGTVVYELKDGPYDPLNDKDFATWAPKESDSDASSYLKKLIVALQLNI